METTTSIGKLAEALAKAQAEFGPIEKNRTVEVRSDKGAYKFDYATLDEVLAKTRPALSRNGLALVQLLEGGAADVPRLRTLLLHASGERLEAIVSLPSKPQKAQELGSMITYLRRYSIVSILGVVAEEDDDGNAGDGNERDARERTPRGKPAVLPSTKGFHQDGTRQAPPPDLTERQLRLTKLVTGKAPDGLGFSITGAKGWLKKRFGKEMPQDLTEQQLKDAEILALSKMTGEKEYAAKVAELAKAGRCTGDEVAA